MFGPARAGPEPELEDGLLSELSDYTVDFGDSMPASASAPSAPTRAIDSASWPSSWSAWIVLCTPTIATS